MAVLDVRDVRLLAEHVRDFCSLPQDAGYPVVLVVESWMSI